MNSRTPITPELLNAKSDYAERKRISEEIDRELGYRFESTEETIRSRTSDHENWSHLSPQIFQTPYGELAEIIERVDRNSSPLSTWVDLGAAYGRLAFVLSVLRPEAMFFGIELEPERVAEGNRVLKHWNLPRATLTCADLTTVEIPRGDAYFLYDFGTQSAINQVLERLKDHARASPLLLIGRGRRIRDTIERHHPWLCEVIPPEHTAHFSIYRSA